MELCSSRRMQTLNPIGSGRASRGVIGNLASTCLEPITVGAPLARGRARTLEARRPKQATQWKELAMQADAAFRCSQPDEARMVYCDRLLMASESRLPGALRKTGFGPSRSRVRPVYFTGFADCFMQSLWRRYFRRRRQDKSACPWLLCLPCRFMAGHGLSSWLDI